MARPLPGLAEIARAADKRVAFFYNWEPLRDLSRPGSVHYSYFRDSAFQADGDDKIVEEASRFIPQERPDLAFIYFGTVDTAGHQYGWMTDEYLRQLEHVDSLLGRLFDSLPEEYTAIVHSDHGGHERNHGTDSDEDMMIPWMAVGPNIRQAYTIQKEVSLLDTAPTLAKILEIKSHHEWEGRAVAEMFVS